MCIKEYLLYKCNKHHLTVFHKMLYIHFSPSYIPTSLLSFHRMDFSCSLMEKGLIMFCQQNNLCRSLDYYSAVNIKLSLPIYLVLDSYRLIVSSIVYKFSYKICSHNTRVHFFYKTNKTNMAIGCIMLPLKTHLTKISVQKKSQKSIL